ncbi:hypothetical protein FFLO_03895 [Filobasidium floriforme]|uniref:Uncharacterized protein n=1 Tax=Filobasidium floriforme TaxID=5210 RepID=A0A8K0JL79_9TREE|nr:uncharacterized protein HD553DRAFT_23335 [Filobasidium floriforme]KAG7532020.1 hypothetical protein FFLO_03895 [Filobasidium floriforme]KAH8085202.1 hypothetical protein HD553DRAFT_23335 [Filobasidium floriforme]
MHQPPPQHAYANHPTMLRTPSYGGGPMVVTPDDEAFGAYNNGYSMHPQFRQPMPPTNMSANTSPASTRPPVGSIGYGAPPARPLDRVPTPGSATFPGQLDPAITANTMSDPVSSTTNTKLPGRYSLDARLHTTSSPSLERNDLGTRSASADGMIEQTVQLPGQPNTTIKRMSRDGYFEGAFNVLPRNRRQLALHRLPCRSTSLRENLWRPAPTTDPVQMLGTRRQGGTVHPSHSLPLEAVFTELQTRWKTLPICARASHIGRAYHSNTTINNNKRTLPTDPPVLFDLLNAGRERASHSLKIATTAWVSIRAIPINSSLVVS